MAQRPIPPAIPPTPLWLGLAGLAPFYVSASLSTGAHLVQGLAGWHEVAQASFCLYAAVILSFLGGVRWGLAMGASATPRTSALIYATVPSIVAWAGVLAVWLQDDGARFLPVTAIAAAFLVQFLWDRGADRDGAPAWYARLRLMLTLGVLGACLILAIGAAVRQA